MDVKFGYFTFTFFKQFLLNTEIYIIRLIINVRKVNF